MFSFLKFFGFLKRDVMTHEKWLNLLEKEFMDSYGFSPEVAKELAYDQKSFYTDKNNFTPPNEVAKRYYDANYC
jgi:hypothetical protein